MIPAYSSPLAYGHKHLQVLVDENPEVYVQEKVDGSQCSFRREDFGLTFRSKGQAVDPLDPGMFRAAVESLQELVLLLEPYATYRGEYLSKPKHNALAYDRVPTAHVILFDIDMGDQDYVTAEGVLNEAAQLGLEAVPVLWWGRYNDLTPEVREQLLETPSVLGGQKIEGFVVKPRTLYIGQDKKALMAKVVSPAFKEVHSKEWKKGNPGQNDFIAQLVERYRTPARWNKAIQHLTEAGSLVNAGQDIPALMREVGEDTLKECKEEILDLLWKYAWPKVQRGITKGLPEHYKEYIANNGT